MITSIQHSGINLINTSQNRATTAASNIASENKPQLAENLVSLKLSEYEAKAGVAVLKAYNSTIGSLLNVNT